MNDGTVKLDNDHQTLVNWGVTEMNKVISFMSVSEIEAFLNQHITKKPAEIEAEFSNLLDMTNEDAKFFLQNLLIRKEKAILMAEKSKAMQEEAKRKHLQKKKQKMEECKTKKRDMWYCQALIHELVSNCTGCGRIVCEEEGEGDCLFWGAYVESHMLPFEDEKVDPALKNAISMRDKLIEYDSNELMHQSIRDQGSDWYELENNTWHTKEQRTFAKRIREMEEKRNLEQLDATYVTIGGDQKDMVTMKGGTVKSDEEISKEANEYINQLAQERLDINMQELEEAEEFDGDLKDIKITQCTRLDAKSQDLFDQLKRDVTDIKKVKIKLTFRVLKIKKMVENKQIKTNKKIMKMTGINQNLKWSHLYDLFIQ